MTLEHEVGPGSETIVNVSYIENDVFTFTAEKGGLEGIARCQVGPLAVGSGAADLLVYRTQIDPTTVIFEIDCAANWSGELPVD